MKFCLCLYAFCFFSFNCFVSAQTVSVESLPEGGPTANKLILPKYPIHANAYGVGGRVSIPIEIDETGKVISVGEASGPYPICQSVSDEKVLAIRGAAIEAARISTFKPYPRSEKMTSANRGRIVYVFSPNPSMKLMRLDRANIAQAVQDDNSDQEYDTKIVSAHEVGSRAKSIPQPPYPPAAKAVRAGGQVQVHLLILEDGSVYSAEAKDGHPLLRSVSESAACRAKFMPTLLSGEAVKVSGIVTYNFVP